MKMMNALMPGEHDWMQGKPMPGQTPAPMATPEKKRGPLMNALGGILEFGAPEAYEAGRQKKINRELGTRLAGGDYAGAGTYALEQGNLEQGLGLRDYADQQTAQRQQEAQGVMQLFSNMQPLQINDYALSDPAGFEQMTGMTSEEYLDTASRLQQAGMTPEQFHAYVIQKAQAELGIAPQGPAEGKAINDRLVNPYTGEVMGDFSDPAKPVEGWEDYAPSGAPGGFYQRNTVTGEVKRVAGPDTPAGGGSGAAEYGLSPVYGLDANGRRVILQTSKSGELGMPKIPEGVTLLDEYGKAFETTRGREDAKKGAYQTQAGMGVLAAEEAFNRISSQIDQAINISNANNTGLIMGNAPAPNLSGLLETIGANTAFDTLVSLKSQGGTLGAISQSELDLLKAKVANLKRSQSQEQLDANLELLRVSMQNSMMRIKQAYEAEYANGTYGQAASAPSVGGRVGPSGQPPPEGFE